MSKHTNLSIINYLVILVVHDHNHGVVVHGLAFEKYVQLVSHCSHWRFNFGFWYILLTNKELKVLETPQNILHVAIDVLLEGVHLVCPAVALEVGDDLLHVVLQVHSVVLLGPKARLGETVVENDVDPTGKESLGEMWPVTIYLGSGGYTSTPTRRIQLFPRQSSFHHYHYHDIHLVELGSAPSPASSPSADAFAPSSLTSPSHRVSCWVV